MVDEQPQIEFGAVQLGGRQASRPSRSAARATAIASMLSDFPRVRAPRRASAIKRVGTRSTRSPRAIKHRSSAPETCRQSSSAHTRSLSSLRAQTTNAAKPLAPTWIVCSPTTSPVGAETAAIVCERL